MNAVCALTGATGYVGSLISTGLSDITQVVPLSRRAPEPTGIQWDFESNRDISEELRAHNAEALVHSAWDMRANTLSELEARCVEGSKRLYSMAHRAQVKRIVFVSTISAFDNARSAYGRSKLAVEKLTTDMGGVVLRLGLVYGPAPRGVFGTLRDQVRKSSVIPLIGSGRAPQYLLHEDTLRDVIRRAVTGDFDASSGRPLTIAHPHPWPFRDLVSAIARRERRSVHLVPTPWPLLYAGLRSAEALSLKLPIRSDSVISFVYQNPEPDFSGLKEYEIEPKPFDQ
jgi:nucleoside-diphosphate-sugar epimerase